MGSFDLWLARRTVGEVLFDSEVANLIRRHYPQAMRLTYGSFSSFFSPFRRSIRDTDCSKRDRIPFLIVFPEKAIPIERQLDRIRFDDQRCVARLKLTNRPLFHIFETLLNLQESTLCQFLIGNIFLCYNHLFHTIRKDTIVYIFY